MARILISEFMDAPAVETLRAAFDVDYRPKLVDDAAGLDAYQVHPAHQEVVGYVRSVAGGRSAVDFEV